MNKDLHDLLLNECQVKTVQLMPREVKQHPSKPDYFMIEQQVNVWGEFKKTKPNLSDLKVISEPIAVLGAGPSLPKDLKKLPKSCKFISANQHALRLVNPWIMCFLDPIEQQKGSEFYEAVVNPKGYLRCSINDLENTDFYVVNEYPEELSNPSDTGRFALWLASRLTTSDIYLCGIGLREQGKPNHFYDDEPLTTWGGPDMNKKIEGWMRFINWVGKERVKIMSGPLKHRV